MTQSSTRAAALAAVSAYLQQEEEIRRTAEAVVPVVVAAPAEFSQWSHSGRQEMMAMRRLIQLRVFDRPR